MDVDIDFKTLLEEEKAELSSRLEELGVGDNRLEFDSNFADSSQVTAERAELERLASELKEALRAVDVALAKIESGTYGVCEKCGGMIDPARLEAKPAAIHCVACASSR